MLINAVNTTILTALEMKENVDHIKIFESVENLAIMATKHTYFREII